MHSLACVPNDTLKVRVEGNPHAANLHMLPKSLGRKVQSGLLVACSRYIYPSGQRESRYCCQGRRLVPKGLYMGDHIYFSKHSSAAKGILWHSNHQFIMTVAPQARHKKHAPAGPGTTQVTATQWLILFSIEQQIIITCHGYHGNSHFPDVVFSHVLSTL